MGKNVQAILNKKGQEAVKAIRDALKVTRPKGWFGRRGNTIATGKLYNSIGYKVTSAGVLLIYGMDYLKNVIDGRRAGATPPPIAPIEAWIKAKPIATGKNSEKKQRGRAAKYANVRSPIFTPKQNAVHELAVVISKSIGKRGIRPIPLGGVKTKGSSINALVGKEITRELANAASKDIKIEFLKIGKK